jgi:hypothetical protein
MPPTRCRAVIRCPRAYLETVPSEARGTLSLRGLEFEQVPDGFQMRTK